MVVSLIVIGLISILGQVVLLRELNVAFYGIELIYLLALGIWLFWTAVGALIDRKKWQPSADGMAVLFLLCGICFPADIVFIRASRLLFSGVPGAYLSFPHQLTIIILALMPVGLLLGLLFQWGAKIYVADGRTLAKAYAIESAGGLAGGLLGTITLRLGIQNYDLAFIFSLACILTPIVFLPGKRTFSCRSLSVVLSILTLLLLWKADIIDRKMTAWNHPALLESRDSPYGRVTVTRLAGQVAVFENDALAFETEGTEAEYFTHLSALQHPAPRHVLILGGGIEGTLKEILKHAPQRIDYVELNPVMVNMVSPYLPDDVRESLAKSNVNVIFSDPRQFLRENRRYDLIMVGMPEPTSGQANRFYTREFFEQCAARLNSGGVLSFRLRSAENIWTPPLARRTTSIHRALNAVFPEIVVLPGTTNIITASRDPLPHTPEAPINRLRDRNLKTRLITADYIRYLYTNDRYFEISERLKRGYAVPNTDVRPVCYQYTFTIWLSKFFPRIAALDPSSLLEESLVTPRTKWMLWIGLPLLFLISRLWPAGRRILLVAVAGFIGMALETVLILQYQVKHGVLFQDIGLLLMSFMGGLALGAVTINGMMAFPMGRRGRKPTRWWGVGLVAGFCLLCAAVVAMIRTGAFSGLFSIALFLASAGFLVAGLFAYASLYQIRDQKKMVSPLYSADLLGGCLGSLASSLLFIPLTGLDVSTEWILLLAAASILLV
jgi:spermidine synthase